jgi:hypothetical protein
MREQTWPADRDDAKLQVKRHSWVDGDRRLIHVRRWSGYCVDVTTVLADIDSAQDIWWQDDWGGHDLLLTKPGSSRCAYVVQVPMPLELKRADL